MLVSNTVFRVPLLIKDTHIRVQISDGGDVTFAIAPKDAGEEVLARIFLWDLQTLLDANQVMYRKFFGRHHTDDALFVPREAHRAQFWLAQVRALACEPPTVVH